MVIYLGNVCDWKHSLRPYSYFDNLKSCFMIQASELVSLWLFIGNTCFADSPYSTSQSSVTSSKTATWADVQSAEIIGSTLLYCSINKWLRNLYCYYSVQQMVWLCVHNQKHRYVLWNLQTNKIQLHSRYSGNQIWLCFFQTSSIKPWLRKLLAALFNLAISFKSKCSSDFTFYIRAKGLCHSVEIRISL